MQGTILAPSDSPGEVSESAKVESQILVKYKLTLSQGKQSWYFSFQWWVSFQLEEFQRVKNGA